MRTKPTAEAAARLTQPIFWRHRIFNVGIVLVATTDRFGSSGAPFHCHFSLYSQHDLLQALSNDRNTLHDILLLHPTPSPPRPLHNLHTPLVLPLPLRTQTPTIKPLHHTRFQTQRRSPPACLLAIHLLLITRCAHPICHSGTMSAYPHRIGECRH